MVDNYHKTQDGLKRDFTLSRLFPNMVTIAAICFGLTSIRYALDNKLEISIALIVVAGLLDVIDGRLARFLKATSNFGAQLDSLADFVNFGVAPAIITYIWRLKEIPIKGLGWSIVLFFAICSVIRLARFNVDVQDSSLNDFYRNYFVGVPSPMGAYIIGIPMMLEFNRYYSIQFNYYIIGAIVVMSGLLMVSRLPTIAIKKFAFKPQNINYILVVFVSLIGLLIIEPWLTLSFIGFIYITSIPITSYIHFKKQL
jgi:CDP-diacylglycerol--serine O-phosphatidyltransferase